MAEQSHTKRLHRGYANNLRVEWERRGKSGFAYITLLNAKKQPVAVLLGDYEPGELDADMEAAANLFCAAPDLFEACVALTAAMRRYEVEVDADAPQAHRDMMDAADAAISKALGAPNAA